MKRFSSIFAVALASVVVGVLVAPREAVAQRRILTLFGSVKGGQVPNGEARLAFNFYESDSDEFLYRTVATATVRDGVYSANVPVEGLAVGEEYWVMVTSPEEMPNPAGGGQQRGGGINGLVLLQATTPGTQQTGHVNISGTLIAAFFKGDGSEVTSVNADRLDGLDSSAFLRVGSAAGGDLTATYPDPVIDVGAVTPPKISFSGASDGQALTFDGVTVMWGNPIAGGFLLPFSATGSTIGPLLGLTNTHSSGVGVHGIHSSASGTAAGVHGETRSLSGGAAGVLGEVTSQITEFAAGVRGIHHGPGGEGYGVWGSSEAFGVGVAGTSNTVGVAGYSVDGFGVQSEGDMQVLGDLYVSGSKAGYVTDVVLNGGDLALETGDLIEITGFADPIQGEVPVIVVRLARTAQSAAVLGPIDCALLLTQMAERKYFPVPRPEYDSPRFYLHKMEGPIGPGEYGRVVTLGSFKAIKVDASYGPIRPGDLLVSSPTPGYAMAVPSNRIAVTGTVIGKALGSLQKGWGEIPVLVQSR